MKKCPIAVICVLVTLVFAAAAWAESGNPPRGQSNSPQTYYGPDMMGPGYEYGYGPGPSMMGPGYGYGYGMRPGMAGPGFHRRGWRGYGMGYGMGPGAPGWQSMSPQERLAWQKMYNEYKQKTLKLRQEFVTKHMEMETLWAQPDPDQDRMRELSKQLSDIQGKLAQERDQFLLQCRKQYGDKGWACPGGF